VHVKHGGVEKKRDRDRVILKIQNYNYFTMEEVLDNDPTNIRAINRINSIAIHALTDTRLQTRHSYC
jgi:hypothetical protein